MNYRLKKTLRVGAFVLMLVGIWEMVFLLHLWPIWLFPSPEAVGRSLLRGLNDGSIFWGALISIRRLFVGFFLSIVIGTLTGIFLAKNKIVEDTLLPFILGLQTLPSICWLPLALLWFGLNEQAILFVIVMGTILSITISVKSAIERIPRAYLKAGRMLGADGLLLYRHIIFPAMLPSYVHGMRHGWSFAWRSLMSGEMLFVTAGLGQLLMLGRELNDLPRVMAIMIVIVFIGFLFDQTIFAKLEKNLKLRWGT